MINGCVLKCNGKPVFIAPTGPAEYLCFSAVIILQVGALVLGILGLLKVGPFANMPPAASYGLIGVGAAVWLVDLALFCQKCIKDQRRLEKSKQLGEPIVLDPEADATFEAEVVVPMGQSKTQSATITEATKYNHIFPIMDKCYLCFERAEAMSTGVLNKLLGKFDKKAGYWRVIDERFDKHLKYYVVGFEDHQKRKDEKDCYFYFNHSQRKGYEIAPKDLKFWDGKKDLPLEDGLNILKSKQESS